MMKLTSQTQSKRKIETETVTYDVSEGLFFTCFRAAHPEFVPGG